jgi:small neutral amino acid transporter SnatA (MarC family)
MTTPSGTLRPKNMVALEIGLVLLSAASLIYPLSTPLFAGGGVVTSALVYRRDRSTMALVALVMCTAIFVAGALIDLFLIKTGARNITVRSA